jgi:hypothetical protein
MSRKMDETIPLLVMAAVAVLTVRWLFKTDSQDQNRNPDELRRLQAMFPNIPAPVIRDELSRAGSLQSCIDRLLQISERIMSPTIASARPEDASALEDKDVGLYEERFIDPKSVDRASWEKDASIRQALLKSRKASLLKQARQCLLEKEGREK